MKFNLFDTLMLVIALILLIITFFIDSPMLIIFGFIVFVLTIINFIQTIILEKKESESISMPQEIETKFTEMRE
jgi:hypothetical protein